MPFNIVSGFLIRVGKQARAGRLCGRIVRNGADNFHLWQSQREDWPELDVDHAVRHSALSYS